MVRPTPRDDDDGTEEAHPHLLDVRTCVAAGARGYALKQAATRRGSAAELGEHAKVRKWDMEARSQGYRFLSLCIEEGGRLGDGFKQFLDPKLWCVKHPASFRAFARNHVHITNLKAVTRVIQVNAQILIPAAYRVPETASWILADFCPQRTSPSRIQPRSPQGGTVETIPARMGLHMLRLSVQRCSLPALLTPQRPSEPNLENNEPI